MNRLCFISVILLTLLSVPLVSYAHCKGKHTGDHEHCTGGEDPPPASGAAPVILVHDIGSSESIDVMDANGGNLLVAYKASRKNGLNNWRSIQWSPGGTFIAFSADGQGRYCQQNVETFMLPLDLGSMSWDNPTNFACLEAGTRHFEILGAGAPLDDSTVRVLWRNPGNGLRLTDPFEPGDTTGSIVPSVEVIPSPGFGFDIERLSVSPAGDWLAYNRGPGLELAFVSEFGSFGSVTEGAGPGLFNLPRAIAVDSQNQIIITDRDNHRIQICNDQGSCTVVGAEGPEVGNFSYPQGITVDSHEHIIVSDMGNLRVQICDYVGNCTAFGGQGVGPGQFLNDTNSLDVDGQDRIFVVGGSDGETFGDRFQICDHAGDCSVVLFDAPHGLDVDYLGNVIISSGGFFNGDQTVSICDESGFCSSVFGGPGDAPGQFNGPYTLEADTSGRIFVADSNNNRIQVCDYEGNCMAYGSLGTGPGQFDKPSAIALDLQLDHLIIGDTSNHRIEIFNIGAQINENSLVVRSFDATAVNPNPIAGAITLELLASNIGVTEFANLRYSSHSNTTLVFTSQDQLYCLDISNPATPNLVHLSSNLPATTLTHDAAWRPDGSGMVVWATQNASSQSEQMVIADLAFNGPNSVGGCPESGTGTLNVLATGDGSKNTQMFADPEYWRNAPRP